MENADIPVVILCGGMGTRLREASEKLPKPLVDIGGKPILWHVMKSYEKYGFRRFILCLGYKSDLIKRYFLDYRAEVSDFTLQMGDLSRQNFHTSRRTEDWTVTFVETGLLSGTGARVRRIERYLSESPRFMLTYGDGIGDVDLDQLLKVHERSGRMGTVTAVHPNSRYGEMKVEPGSSLVTEFSEKPNNAEGWVSGGFFVFENAFVAAYLDDDPSLMLEQRPLTALARERQLSVHRHEGFWMGMDTFRDWTELNSLWDSGAAPWKTWSDEPL